MVYVLSKLDPANQVVFNAVRYLSAHRNVRGLWTSLPIFANDLGALHWA